MWLCIPHWAASLSSYVESSWSFPPLMHENWMTLCPAPRKSSVQRAFLTHGNTAKNSAESPSFTTRTIKNKGIFARKTRNPWLLWSRLFPHTFLSILFLHHTFSINSVFFVLLPFLLTTLPFSASLFGFLKSSACGLFQARQKTHQRNVYAAVWFKWIFDPNPAEYFPLFSWNFTHAQHQWSFYLWKSDEYYIMVIILFWSSIRTHRWLTMSGTSNRMFPEDSCKISIWCFL